MHRHQGGARRAHQAPHRRPVARLLQAGAPREVPGPPRRLLEGVQGGVQGQADHRSRGRQGAPGLDRQDRRDVARLRRTREDATSGRRRLDSGPMSEERGRPRPRSSLVMRAAALGAGVAAVTFARRWLDVVEVQGGSMAPTLLPGEWLLVERGTSAQRRPRVGEIVLPADPREPSRELIKRVAAVDADSETLVLRGDDAGASTDSRTFGELPAGTVRWRVIARYYPPGRIGRV